MRLVVVWPIDAARRRTQRTAFCTRSYGDGQKSVSSLHRQLSSVDAYRSKILSTLSWAEWPNFRSSVTSSSDDVIVTMQKIDCRDWTSAQTTSEFGQWRHLPASFGRPPDSQIFDTNCFHDGHCLAPPTTTSYVEQVRREWIANYFSYHRLKQLERWSEVDQKPDRTMSTTGVDSASCSSRWTCENDDRQLIYRDLNDQFSNGPYMSAFCCLCLSIRHIHGANSEGGYTIFWLKLKV